MALIRSKDVAKMSQEERNAKLKELELELVKSYVTANKTTAKTKEIKRTIARLITFSKPNKVVLKKK